MKVGLFITNQQTLDTDMVSALDDQFAMVRLARDCGWDSLFSGQHYLNEGNNKQLQTVPLLARLAAEAGEMTIGLGILLLNLHNPVYTAETVATLDIIARGKRVAALLLRAKPYSLIQGSPYTPVGLPSLRMYGGTRLNAERIASASRKANVSSGL